MDCYILTAKQLTNLLMSHTNTSTPVKMQKAWHSIKELPEGALDNEDYLVLIKEGYNYRLAVSKWRIVVGATTETHTDTYDELYSEIYAGFDKNNIVAWMPVPDFSDFIKDGE